MEEQNVGGSGAALAAHSKDASVQGAGPMASATGNQPNGQAPGDAVRQAAGEFGEQVQDKAEDVAGGARQAYGNAKESISSAASDAGATIIDMAHRMSSRASDVGEKAYEQGGIAAKYVDEQVRQQPWAAMLLAAVVGVGIGVMLGRPPSGRSFDVGPFRGTVRRR